MKTGVQWVRARLASRLVRIVIAAAVVVGVAVYVTAHLLGWGQVSASAMFGEAKNLYPGDSVEILGVKVGAVDSVTTLSNGARVTFHYDSKYKVPAGAEAVIVAPELVSDRYLELTPAYSGGPVLAAGTTIPQNRTAVPVEWDQTMKQLDQLVTALGPNGANKNGAISRFLGTASEYKGEGQLFHNTMQQVSAATQTLSSGSQNLFGNVRNLEVFTSALASSDQQITAFIDRFSTVSGILNDDRKQLSGAISELDQTAPVVSKFIDQNQSAITEATDNSAQVARLLSSERLELANALQVAPTVLSNFYYIYDPLAAAYTGALNVPNLENPAQFICSAIGAAAQASSPEAATSQCQKTAGPLLKLLQINYAPVSANPVPRPGAPSQTSLNNGVPGLPSSLQQMLNPGGS